MTPNEYRRLGEKSLFLKKIEFDTEYLRHINQNISLVPEIIEQNAMRMVGLSTRFYSVDSEKNNIGEKLPALWSALLARASEIQHVVPGLYYGVVRQLRDDTDQLEYCAAIEVSKVESLPDDMVIVDVPPSTYAKFTHRGEVKRVDITVNYIYSSWLLSSGKRHTSGPDLEL
jgi:AraC family transcriptional regulator